MKQRRFRSFFIVLCLVSIVLYSVVKIKWFRDLRSEFRENPSDFLENSKFRNENLYTESYLSKIIKVPSDSESSENDESPGWKNVLDAKVQPKNGKNIFLIDSSESTSNVILTARQACAIESAAFTNPHLRIFFVYASAERLQALQTTPELESILSYENVFIRFLNATQLSLGSPMEHFIQSDKLATSNYKLEQTSDALRLLVLWKFGGIYVDTDMIVRKKLDSVPSNFACRQSEGEINNGILGFNDRTLAEIFIAYLDFYFNGAMFTSNGPMLITRVAKLLCRIDDMQRIIEMKSCQGFYSLDRPFCYEISFPEWTKLMDEKFTEEVLQRVENSIVVHFWNYVSKNTRLKTDSNAPYIELARQFCPKVINSCGEYF